MEFLKEYYGENYPAFAQAFVKEKITRGLFSYMIISDKAIVALDNIIDLVDHKNYINEKGLDDEAFTLDIEPAQKN